MNVMFYGRAFSGSLLNVWVYMACCTACWVVHQHASVSRVGWKLAGCACAKLWLNDKITERRWGLCSEGKARMSNI